jgi:LemA protein
MIWILLAVLVLLALFLVVNYNKLVKFRERYRNAFAQIDVQLKRRYDLIPNLVETAKGYMKHERETLEAVTQARTRAQQAESKAAQAPGEPEAMKGLLAAEQALTGAMGKFFALSESYPDLKANQNMLSLQEELSTTENRIAFARQAYNDAVMRYNTLRASVPTNIVANAFNFGPAELFEIELEEEREAPEVSF